MKALLLCMSWLIKINLGRQHIGIKYGVGYTPLVNNKIKSF